MDPENDSLLQCFIEEDQCLKIKEWCDANGHKRSDIFETRLDKGDKLREMGNEFFKKEEYDEAQWRYFAAIYHVDFDVAQQSQLMDHHMAALNTRKTKMISNVCATYLKQKNWVMTKTAAESGLRHLQISKLDESEYPFIKDSRAKFHYRHALANMERGFNEDAYDQLKKAVEIMPNDKEVRKALDEAKSKSGEDKVKAKEVFKNVLLTEEEKKIQASWWRSRWRDLKERVWERCCAKRKKPKKPKEDRYDD